MNKLKKILAIGLVAMSLILSFGNSISACEVGTSNNSEISLLCDFLPNHDTGKFDKIDCGSSDCKDSSSYRCRHSMSIRYYPVMCNKCHTYANQEVIYCTKCDYSYNGDLSPCSCRKIN